MDSMYDGYIELGSPEHQKAGVSTALYVRFTKSTLAFRRAWPPRRGDFMGNRYYTGKNWVRLSQKGRRRVAAGLLPGGEKA